MKERLSLITLFIFIIITISCSDEDTKREILSNPNGFTLSYSMDEPHSVLTRSIIDVEEGEDRLSSFYILFFENTTGGTGNFLEAIDVRESVSGDLFSTGNVNIEFPSGSGLKNSEKYTMLLCSNIEAYTHIYDIESLITFCDGKTENEVTGLLLQSIEGVAPGDQEQQDDTNRIFSAELPMGAKYIKEANVSQVTVELTRTVARFDVFCEAAGYELFSASIWNAYTEGFVWEGNFTDYIAPRTERFYGVKANREKEIIGSLYAFENYVPDPEQNDKVSTCLIIGLKNLETNHIEYFRTNVNASNTYGQQLERNNAYRTIIKNVLSKGDENERGAYENEKLLLDIDVNEWKVDDSGTIQVSGEKVLAMPTSIARLFAQGETREYYVYTIGQGVPAITGEYLPENIKATLKLAPGYSENADFKKSILTFHADAGTTKNRNETYKVDITFANLNASVTVEQIEGNRDYLHLNLSEMIEVNVVGQPSENVTVASSGTWVAEILKSDLFSFSSRTAQYRVEGTSGESFNVYAIENNTTGNTHYWFVRVYLKDKPEVSQNLVIAQPVIPDQNYLIITPDIFDNMSAGGGSTVPITIYSSGAWTGTVIDYENAAAYFETYPKPVSPNLQETFTGQNGTSFVITFNSLVDDLLSPGYVTFRFTLNNNTSVTKTVTIRQQPITESTPVMHVMIDNLPGALYHMDRAYVYDYAYNMAVNLRELSVIGDHTIEPFAFINRGSYRDGSTLKYRPFEQATLFQMPAHAGTQDCKDYIIPWLKNHPERMMLFSANSKKGNMGAGYIFSAFYTGGYFSSSQYNNSTSDNSFLVDLNIAGSVERVLYEERDGSSKTPDLGHPVLCYLLKDGPYGEVDPAGVKLYSSTNNVNVGIDLSHAQVPATFIPIIMVEKNKKKYCVLGIDLYYRFIFLGDPGIMGAREDRPFPNAGNYTADNPDNVILFNNLMAWIKLAVTQEGFMEQFGTIKK